MLPFWFDANSDDINVHARHRIEIALQVVSEANVPETLTGRAIFFEVAKPNALQQGDALLRVALLAGSVANRRIIRVTSDQLAALARVSRRLDYLVRDEDAAPPQVLLAGKLNIYGPGVSA